MAIEADRQEARCNDCERRVDVGPDGVCHDCRERAARALGRVLRGAVESGLRGKDLRMCATKLTGETLRAAFLRLVDGGDA